MSVYIINSGLETEISECTYVPDFFLTECYKYLEDNKVSCLHLYQVMLEFIVSYIKLCYFMFVENEIYIIFITLKIIY